MEFESYSFLMDHMDHDGPWRISIMSLVFYLPNPVKYADLCEAAEVGNSNPSPMMPSKCHRMPSDIIGSIHRRCRCGSNWIDQHRTQAHCITIRYYTSSKEKNAALPLYTLYFRVKSLWEPSTSPKELDPHVRDSPSKETRKKLQSYGTHWNPTNARNDHECLKDCLFRGENLETSAKNGIVLEILKTLLPGSPWRPKKPSSNDSRWFPFYFAQNWFSLFQRISTNP